MTQTKTDNFGGLHKNMNCAFLLIGMLYHISEFAHAVDFAARFRWKCKPSVNTEIRHNITFIAEIKIRFLKHSSVLRCKFIEKLLSFIGKEWGNF